LLDVALLGDELFRVEIGKKPLEQAISAYQREVLRYAFSEKFPAAIDPPSHPAPQSTNEQGHSVHR
jgi:hypothetical protein